MYDRQKKRIRILIGDRNKYPNPDPSYSDSTFAWIEASEPNILKAIELRAITTEEATLARNDKICGSAEYPLTGSDQIGRAVKSDCKVIFIRSPGPDVSEENRRIRDLLKDYNPEEAPGGYEKWQKNR